MKFEAVPVEEAKGHILGHNITGTNGRRLLRKGKPISGDTIEILKGLGRRTVYVALMDANDVDENTAALRIAQSTAGTGINLSKATTGRVNMAAEFLGVMRVDVSRLAAVNRFEGVTLGTLPQHRAVAAGETVATLKVIPYALPGTVVEQAVDLAAEPEPVLAITQLEPRRVALILSGAPEAQPRVLDSFQPALAKRLGRLNATIEHVEYVPLEEEIGERQLAAAIRNQVAMGIEVVILAGETAIMDRYDVTPRAVERTGGEVTCFGAPVDPGNLLMLAYLGEVPILGAPGCVRSPKLNIVDLVLPRILVGDRLVQEDIVALAHGGLLT